MKTEIMTNTAEKLAAWNTAAALYGDYWHNLPDSVATVLRDWLRCDLLGLPAARLLDPDECAFEFADGAAPIYYDEQLALLADTATREWLEQYSDGDREDKLHGESVYAFACRVAVSAWVCGVAAELALMLDELTTSDGFEALGLDADAAEVAAALLPEWAGTVGELVEAAPRLAVAS
jgi:hypothetical protein